MLEFQWAPTLGGECYVNLVRVRTRMFMSIGFQWAPTLGGECYKNTCRAETQKTGWRWFQWAPTLGGECYVTVSESPSGVRYGFNGHPPLGVNATSSFAAQWDWKTFQFQWAPTLGGECYQEFLLCIAQAGVVSMGTHPWG